MTKKDFSAKLTALNYTSVFLHSEEAEWEWRDSVIFLYVSCHDFLRETKLSLVSDRLS